MEISLLDLFCPSFNGVPTLMPEQAKRSALSLLRDVTLAVMSRSSKTIENNRVAPSLLILGKAQTRKETPQKAKNPAVIELSRGTNKFFQSRTQPKSQRTQLKSPPKNSTEEHALRKHGCDNPKVSGGCFTSLVELSDITTV